jgi:hypothetical protein
LSKISAQGEKGEIEKKHVSRFGHIFEYAVLWFLFMVFALRRTFLALKLYLQWHVLVV